MSFYDIEQIKFKKLPKETSKILQPVEAVMMFVVRYREGERFSLQGLHDASTYTVDISLNERGIDYEGGGVRYVRYNCTIFAIQTGTYFKFLN